jgi:hypothetical protein
METGAVAQARVARRHLLAAKYVKDLNLSGSSTSCLRKRWAVLVRQSSQGFRRRLLSSSTFPVVALASLRRTSATAQPKAAHRGTDSG